MTKLNNRAINQQLPYILIVMSVLAYPLVECLQGFIFKGDTSKALTNMISAIIIVLFVPLIKKNRTVNLLDLSCISLLVIFFALTIGKSVITGSFTYDFYAILRSLVLGVVTYLLAKDIQESQKEKLLIMMALYTWGLITTFIAIAKLGGVGLYTYEEFSAGNKFYFPSVNEITFVYLISFVVIFSMARSLRAKVLFLVATLATFVIVGNKSFVPLLALFFVIRMYLKSKKATRLFFISLLFFMFLLFSTLELQQVIVSSVTDFIVLLLSKYSFGAEKLAVKLSYLNVFSALISERDTLVIIAWDIVCQVYSFVDVVVGVNLSEYGILYGARRGTEFSFSENDVVDLFMSYGLVGLLLFAMMMLNIFGGRPSPAIDKSYELKKTVVLMFVANGLLTGHIFLFGFTCFTFALYSGLLSGHDIGKKHVRFSSEANINAV